MKLTDEQKEQILQMAANYGRLRKGGLGLIRHIERLITEIQAVTVEHCALAGRGAMLNMNCPQRGLLEEADFIEMEIRALSPDPDFLDRKLIKARLEGIRFTKERSVSKNTRCSKEIHDRIADLERQLAAKEGK